MTIKRAHCFFEQSGTFKNAFKHYGIEAFDYDLQNNFGETDFVMDLFGEIEKAYDCMPSVFDSIGKNDLIVAFFPCIYFCEANTFMFRFECSNYRNKPREEVVKRMLERSRSRQYFWELALKMFAVVERRGLRMVVENPFSTQHYLHQYFPYRPKIIDFNRRARGDYFQKPTQYFFINCEPSYCKSFQSAKVKKTVRLSRSAPMGGVCSEDRSMISPNYALNFVNDFLLGVGVRAGTIQQGDLF